MAHAVPFPSSTRVEHRGLAFWMQQALEELALIRSKASPEVVHDLRVALRRCRSVAAAMEEIDPHPDWKRMRDCAKKLFRSLGGLRDTQVMAEWLNEIHQGDDPVKKALLDSLSATQIRAEAKALRQAEKFDTKLWRDLEHSLRSRIRRVPLGSDTAHCLALERLEEAKELHRRALRTGASAPWHALRIGVKRFRYTVESLLPAKYEAWAEALKRVQDILGNIHDLDVLARSVQKARAGQSFPTGFDWEAHIAGIREQNLAAYRQLALGTTSIWQAWLNAFLRQHRLGYAQARIGATRRAMDPKPARSLASMRLSKRIWSLLRTAGLGDIFFDSRELRILETAARLSGIRPKDSGKLRSKSARDFLLKSPLPPAWSFSEWERVSWTIRFQRGPEPGPQNKRFAKLSTEQQAEVCLLAGILRLACAMERMGVRSGTALQLEKLPHVLLVQVAGADDTPENASRFSEAKRLLERSLGKTILIQPRPAPVREPEATKRPDASYPLSIVR